MNAISRNEHLLKVYMNSEDPNDREARAYLSSIRKKLLFVDLSKTSLTQRQWAELIEGTGMHPREIVDFNHELLKREKGQRVDLPLEEWLDVLAKSPEIILGTIVLDGNEAHYFRSPKELIAFVVASPVSQNDSRE